MRNYGSAVRRSNNAFEKKNVRGYVPRRCDLKCYKCRYQGICVVPRILIEAGKRTIRNNIFRNMSLLDNKYKFNDFPTILGYKKRLLRYLTNLKKKLYNKDKE